MCTRIAVRRKATKKSKCKAVRIKRCPYALAQQFCHWWKWSSGVDTHTKKNFPRPLGEDRVSWKALLMM